MTLRTDFRLGTTLKLAQKWLAKTDLHTRVWLSKMNQCFTNVSIGELSRRREKLRKEIPSLKEQRKEVRLAREICLYNI